MATTLQWPLRHRMATAPTSTPPQQWYQENYPNRPVLVYHYDRPVMELLLRNMGPTHNDHVHGTDKSTKDLAKRRKVVTKIKYLHTKTTEVLAAHRTSIFMRVHDDQTTHDQNNNALDVHLQTKMTDYLQNWVNTWKPVKEASIKSARALSVETMGRMDEHFSYLVPPPKRPQRSRVLLKFHTRHAGNRGSRQRPWKVPAFVRPITDYFDNIPQPSQTNMNTSPATPIRPPSPA